MGLQNELPPDPSRVVLKRIYPWDEYNKTLIIQWLYIWSRNEGFTGTIEDFQDKYNALINEGDMDYIYKLVDKYAGSYEVTPLPLMEQILQTTNKILTDDIVIAPIPYYETSNDAGGYTVIIG